MPQLSLAHSEFESLIREVKACKTCPRMCDSVRVLSWANGAPTAPLMFIGEAPGRLGADRTAIPFHGDKAGDNFERLLELAGLSRSDVFVTNAVLCNPRDANGNNAPPNESEISNCAKHLAKQIALVQPAMVMTLGSVALEATRRIERHELTLRGDVRTSSRWNGRLLLPLYHPGARAMIHRSFANQTADYYFVGETFRRLGKPKKARAAAERGSPMDWDIVRSTLSVQREASIFRLHKLLYLIDYFALRKLGRRATRFLYLRQKDGPYCVELGSRWYQRFDQVKVQRSDASLRIVWLEGDLFTPPATTVDGDLREVIDEVVNSTAALTESALKTRVYLTPPMKRLLLEEKAGERRLNYPIQLDAA